MDIKMKPKDVAEWLGISVKTLQRWDANGKLPAHRNDKGRRYYYHNEVFNKMNYEATKHWILTQKLRNERPSLSTLLSKLDIDDGMFPLLLASSYCEDYVLLGADDVSSLADQPETINLEKYNQLLFFAESTLERRNLVKVIIFSLLNIYQKQEIPIVLINNDKPQHLLNGWEDWSKYQRLISVNPSPADISPRSIIVVNGWETLDNKMKQKLQKHLANKKTILAITSNESSELKVSFKNRLAMSNGTNKESIIKFLGEDTVSNFKSLDHLEPNELIAGFVVKNGYLHGHVPVVTEAEENEYLLCLQ